MFSKTNSSKNIPWTLENSFDNPTRLFSPKIRNVFLKTWKQLKVLKILLKRKVFLQKCPLDTTKTVLTTMSKNIYKIPNIFPQSPLVGVNFLEEKDIVMQKDPMNGCRKQFFKSGGTLSDRCPQIFSSKLEKFVKAKFFFRKQTFLEKYCCSSRMHFWQLLWRFCANVADFSADSPKTVKKLKKIIEKTDRSKFSFGQIKCSLNEPVGSSYRPQKSFSFNFRRKTWILSQEKNNLTHNFSITQHFCQKSQKFWSVLEKIVKVFSKIKFSTEFFCTHKMLFCQTFWSCRATMPEFFLHGPETVKNS